MDVIFPHEQLVYSINLLLLAAMVIRYLFHKMELLLKHHAQNMKSC